MKYIRVSVKTRSEAAEALCALLSSVCPGGFEIEDKAEMRAFLEANRQLYDYLDDALFSAVSDDVFVKMYLADDEAEGERLKEIGRLLEGLRSESDGFYGSLEVFTARLDGADWENAWKRYFHALPIGRRLVVLPEWEKPCGGSEDKIIFKVEPGMVFGTGTHESTKLCLEAAEKLVRPGDRVLDLGCGTGILGLTSLLLGASYALGVDIDPGAQAAAMHNAAINKVSGRFSLLIGNALTDESVKRRIGCGYDIIFANIVADVIIAMSGDFKKYLNAGGLVIVSGIIEPRAEQVRSALVTAKLSVISESRERGWVCLTAKAD